MASSLALRRATGGATALFSQLLSHARTASVAPASLTRRSFNTNTEMTNFRDDVDRSVDIDRRSDTSISPRRSESLPTFFSDAFDPLLPTRSLNQIMNMMDQFMENPFMSRGRRGTTGIGSTRGWDVREDENALYLRVEMPGLDKDQVKITVEQNTLVIRGEGDKESEDDAYGRRYSSRLDFPPNLYKIEGVKAEMKNGVLKIVVPKVKDEEKKDVFQVSVE
ncbi:hypothetical protein RD792_009696 [Penstemon davidsonii]|uniref:SHSP domain-containing protein n=1 Tax=Penstemon davidsonii TaxID=160366 RepID=A0ABR0CZY5_9LAMI|nr:hypothetical protein RD792_009696 [Penstemon davidsonii]